MKLAQPLCLLLSAVLSMTLASSGGCGDDATETTDSPEARSEAAVAALSWRKMRDHVVVLADDALAGRVPGSAGHGDVPPPEPVD